MKHKTTLKLEIANQDNTLISPLNLRVSYQVPKSEMDLIPFLDLVLIGFLFFMLSSRMVYTPGVVVDLPKADASVLRPVLVSDVLTVNKRGENILFFYGGAIYDFEGLKNYALTMKGKANAEGSVILVKMDGSLPIQMQADLVAITKQMGYSKVQIAIEPRPN